MTLLAPARTAHTLRALAHLLRYPDDTLRAHLGELREARDFLRETAHIVRGIFSALLDRRSPYASVLAAVLDLAGEKADKVALPEEPELDDSWAEPAAFGGCSTQGQSRPGQPQPIHVVRPSVASHSRPARNAA